MIKTANKKAKQNSETKSNVKKKNKILLTQIFSKHIPHAPDTRRNKNKMMFNRIHIPTQQSKTKKKKKIIQIGCNQKISIVISIRLTNSLFFHPKYLQKQQTQNKNQKAKQKKNKIDVSHKFSANTYTCTRYTIHDTRRNETNFDAKMNTLTHIPIPTKAKKKKKKITNGVTNKILHLCVH